MPSHVLVVTDYSGNLHITPLGNKSFYQSRNKIVKDKQFKFREMTAEQADAFVKQHNGKDPGHVSLSKVDQVIADKDAEIAELRKQLAAKQSEGGKDDDQPAGGTKTAKEVIEAIQAAETIDAVTALIEGEERKSVVEAARKKIASFAN